MFKKLLRYTKRNCEISIFTCEGEITVIDVIDAQKTCAMDFKTRTSSLWLCWMQSTIEDLCSFSTRAKANKSLKLKPKQNIDDREKSDGMNTLRYSCRGYNVAVVHYKK